MFEGKDYVYAVYKTQSFSKAAEMLYVSQPSLSATIKRIEAKLGTPIFDRSTTPIQLTECGQKYIQYIEQLIDMENEFKSDLHDYDQLQAGSLAIGGTNLFASYVLPPLLSQFNAKYPKININLSEADTYNLEKQLFAGSLDLVLDNYDFSADSYTRHFFCREELLLAVPASCSANDHLDQYALSADDIKEHTTAYQNAAAIPLKHFEAERFLLMRSGNDTRKRSDLLFKKAEFAPDVLLKLDQQATAYHIARQGMGLTFVSDTLIRHVSSNPDMVFYRLDESISRRDIFLYRKKTRCLTRPMEEFLKLIPENT